MATFDQPAPVQPFSGTTEVNWHDYFLKQQAFMQDIAKLNEEQAFNASQGVVVNGGITKSGGILLEGGYITALNVELASDNATNAAVGQAAGIYVQHLINNTVAQKANVNSGIRAQIETAQQRAGPFVNDVVGGYFGVRNNGVDVGGFGIHVDAYSNGTGAATTMYGMSAEMYRESSVGMTAAFHARSIDAPGYFDNDYGFLASPSPAGARRFNTIFSGGSSHTGTMNAQIGLDLAHANCTVAAIRINDGQFFYWDGTPQAIFQVYDSVGEWQHWVNLVKNFGLENTGRLFIVNNANTVVNTAFVASADSLVVNIGGTLRKIQLGVFP